MPETPDQIPRPQLVRLWREWAGSLFDAYERNDLVSARRAQARLRKLGLRVARDAEIIIDRVQQPAHDFAHAPR